MILFFAGMAIGTIAGVICISLCAIQKGNNDMQYDETEAAAGEATAAKNTGD